MMITKTLINHRLILSCSLLILIVSASLSSALEERIYEEYCFSGLMYAVGEERAEELKIQSLDEFLNGSYIVHFSETPLQTIYLSNQFNEKDVRVYRYIDVLESSENVDMLFYYTNVYSDDYQFFGCAITSNNLPYKEITYDTINAAYPTPINGSMKMGRIFSSSVNNQLKIKTEKLVINDLVFNLVEIYVDRSSFDSSIRWHGNLTLLVPDVEELPGGRAWDMYVEFRNADSATATDRELLEPIKENKTTRIEMQDLEPIEPKQEGLDYLRISQLFVVVLVAVLVLSLILEKKQEMDEWKG